MKGCVEKQNYIKFFQFENSIGSVDENSLSQIQLNNENLSLTQTMDLEEDKEEEDCGLSLQRRRRNNRLTEKINNNPFNIEEYRKILSLVLEQGPKFGDIGKYFNDRNHNAIKIDIINTFDLDGILQWEVSIEDLIVSEMNRKQNLVIQLNN